MVPGDIYWWIGAVGVPLVGALFGADLYIHRNAQTEREKAIAAKDAEIATLRSDKKAEVDALHARINALKESFHQYQISSASLFATVAAVGEVKRELTTGMTAMKNELSAGLTYIGERLDRIVERNDRRDNH